MIEIWAKFTKFKTASQRLTNQVRTIKEKVWFSDLKILEIYQKVIKEEYQQNSTFWTETLNTVKQEPTEQTETQNNENRNTTHPYTTKQMLTQKGKINVKKKIMTETRTTLPSLRNQDWKKVKVVTEKVNKLLIKYSNR